MLTYLLGPFLAMLPRRWRKALPFSAAVHWTHAAALSGLLEAALAIIAMLYWYSYSVMTWIDHAAGQVAQDKLVVRTQTDMHALGLAAFAVMWIHPVTWFIGYFVLEGAIRLCAAFSGGIFGLLPLAVADGVIRKITGAQSEDSLRPPELKSTFSSVSSAVKDRILTASVPEGADELRLRKSGEEEILEIRATRRKDGWDPPRVVRVDDHYYRLEEFQRSGPPRPFVYVLRRLAAGVPGRTVLLYSTQNAVLTGQR